MRDGARGVFARGAAAGGADELVQQRGDPVVGELIDDGAPRPRGDDDPRVAQLAQAVGELGERRVEFGRELRDRRGAAVAEPVDDA